ncbi:MAG TPA: type 1 glutamine amidotransferase [Pontiella sp.]|nr:type 1 glutamine amidotransferase [Pontiella sp.]
MKLHCLQHVSFEGPGFIEEWAATRGMQIACTRLYEGERPPAPSDFDWLVIMGGPMGIHDHDKHPWLAWEKAFIRESIDAGKTVLGICLGAQLIADVLGARVYPGPHREIGWFPLRRAPGAPGWMPQELTAFHWHGDTFDLPEHSIRLAYSDACQNQGFIHRDRVLGLQFHLESTQQSVEALIENCADELTDGPYIQSAAQIRSACSHLETIHATMSRLLEALPWA